MPPDQARDLTDARCRGGAGSAAPRGRHGVHGTRRTRATRRRTGRSHARLSGSWAGRRGRCLAVREDGGALSPARDGEGSVWVWGGQRVRVCKLKLRASA